MALKMRWAVNIKYTLDFDDLVQSSNVKHFTDNYLY